MRRVTAVVAVPALVLTLSNAWAADVTTNDEMHQNDGANSPLRLVPQSHMFDGINLTEQQRQQLRDLMQQVRHDRSPVSINDLEQLHELIIADKFDPAAYQAQVEKIAHAEVVRQVEIARIRNQMYHLLTPSQQIVLQNKYEQRLNEMRKATDSQLSPSLQAVRNTSSNP